MKENERNGRSGEMNEKRREEKKRGNERKVMRKVKKKQGETARRTQVVKQVGRVEWSEGVQPASQIAN